MKAQSFPAPLPGTFYHKPAPDQPAFKSAGAAVAAGDTIGLIEVMKTFTPVLAEAAGTFVAYLIDNEDAVMAGQPLYEMDV
jgi:biotin carboxyl carrier protein